MVQIPPIFFISSLKILENLKENPQSVDWRRKSRKTPKKRRQKLEIGESKKVERRQLLRRKIATSGEQNFHRQCIAATATSSITQSSLRHAMVGWEVGSR